MFQWNISYSTLTGAVFFLYFFFFKKSFEYIQFQSIVKGTLNERVQYTRGNDKQRT